jgi:hypothetical protein
MQKAVVWGLLILALLMSAASSLFEWYEVFGWYDEVLHAYFSFALSLVLAMYAYDILLTGRRRHEVLLVLAVASLGLAAGVVWELWEWLHDLYTANNSILVKTDTMVDLTLDLAGGLVAGIVSLPMLRHRKK